MTSAEDSIRARRRLTNKLIAAKDAARLAPFFDPGAILIAGDGAPVLGRQAIIEAFAAQFADSAFIAYVREPTSVVLDQNGDRASEHGRWTGTWAAPGRGVASMGGDYLAVWRKVVGQWVIERELYVTLK
jgi:ketosteroid isomerase-like protein